VQTRPNKQRAVGLGGL